MRTLGRTSGNGRHAWSRNSACSTAWASVRRGSVGFLLVLETRALNMGPAFASIALDPLCSLIPVDANETSIFRAGGAALRRNVSRGAGVNQRLGERRRPDAFGWRLHIIPGKMSLGLPGETSLQLISRTEETRTEETNAEHHFVEAGNLRWPSRFSGDGFVRGHGKNRGSVERG